MERWMALLIALGVALPSSAQRGLMDRKRPDLIPLEGQVKRLGFFVAPGVTYCLPPFNDREEEYFRSGDTSYTATLDPAGRFGLYLEAGAYWLTRDPVVLDYWDASLAYKNLRGAEAVGGTWRVGDSASVVNGEGAFAERFITLAVNANKFIRTADYQFVQLSLGANADYRIGSSYTHHADPVLHRHAFPPELIGQLHVKAGYGFKVTGRLFIIPAVETPVFSVVPADEGFGRLQWFSSPYRPLVLSVRFLWLRPRSGFDCPPPVKHNEFERQRHKKYKPDSYHP